ncbi:predicted protein, partial [Nematostella vectensis]
KQMKKEKKKGLKKVKLTAVNQNKYGKYGILVDSDMYTKQPEFYCWLMEIKKVNPEIIGRFETKKYFDDFMEDYNTATLPHKKCKSGKAVGDETSNEAADRKRVQEEYWL